MVSEQAARHALERIQEALDEQDILGYYAAEVDVLERLVKERENAAAIVAGFAKLKGAEDDEGRRR